MSKKEKCNNKCKKTSIGGQAVLEGVMMRGERSMATAVRDESGVIRLETKRLHSSVFENGYDTGHKKNHCQRAKAVEHPPSQ